MNCGMIARKNGPAFGFCGLLDIRRRIRGSSGGVVP